MMEVVRRADPSSGRKGREVQEAVLVFREEVPDRGWLEVRAGTTPGEDGEDGDHELIVALSELSPAPGARAGRAPDLLVEVEVRVLLSAAAADLACGPGQVLGWLRTRFARAGRDVVPWALSLPDARVRSRTVRLDGRGQSSP